MPHDDPADPGRRVDARTTTITPVPYGKGCGHGSCHHPRGFHAFPRGQHDQDPQRHNQVPQRDSLLQPRRDPPITSSDLRAIHVVGIQQAGSCCCHRPSSGCQTYAEMDQVPAREFIQERQVNHQTLYVLQNLLRWARGMLGALGAPDGGSIPPRDIQRKVV